MQRILVDLPEETVKELEALASKRKTSRAEIIRQATDILIKSERAQASGKALGSAFGLWKNDPMTDDDLQTLREEWAR